MGILVSIEAQGEQIKSFSRELLAEAFRLSQSTGKTLSVAIRGDSEAHVRSLKELGVAQIYRATFEETEVPAYVKFLNDAVEASGADLIFGSASSIGKDIFPRLAVRLDSGLVSEVTQLQYEDGKVAAVRPMYSGKALVRVEVQSEKKLFLCRPNSFDSDVSFTAGEAKVVDLDATAGNSAMQLVSTDASQSDRPDLLEAETVVSAGRSIKSAENFNIINDLADALGAAVGASRAAVDAGYAPHDMQVGQTGKTVSPKLYIALGISGAIQHMAGMGSSKVIVAVNTDREAPIFSKCDYGIVGDLFEVVPLLTQAIKKLKEN